MDRADDRDDETYESTGTVDESVLAVHGLALVNPRTIKVATNRRVRAVLPPPIDVVSTAEAGPVEFVDGLSTMPLREALIACRSRVPCRSSRSTTPAIPCPE